MITRILSKRLRMLTGKDKAIIVFGARQVGKTTMIHDVFKSDNDNTLWLI